MRKPTAKRGEVIKSLIRMETWSRDRIAGDVSRAEQMHITIQNEHNQVERTLNDVQVGLRATYGEGVRLEIENIERQRHYLRRIQDQYQDSEQRFQRSKALVDGLRSQLEKQSLRVSGYERAEDKFNRTRLKEAIKQEHKISDEIMLLKRERPDD